MRRLAITLGLVLSWASALAAQDTALGDPISVHGVEVRGFRTREGERALPHIQHRGGARIAITSGRVSELAGGTRSTIRVCDVDAVRTEREMPATASERVTLPGGDPLHHLTAPPRARTTLVRVEIPRSAAGRTRWVTIEWSVPTARRAAMRALEDAFFASIRCAG